jgi:all-trans-retinol 13,14-reductase
VKCVGSAYKQHVLEDRYDAIVIGSGIGGLTAAAILARHAGLKVVVLERHYTAGGFTHVFRRPGYEWDVGVHYVGGVTSPGSEARAAFDHVTEGRLRWQAMPEVYDRVRIADRSYDFASGRERFRDGMKRRFPREADAVDRYLAVLEATAAASGMYFAEKALPPALARFAGPFMRSRFLNSSDRTTAEVLRRFTHDPELIGVLTAQWPDYGLPPAESSFGMHALVTQSYLEGAAYPIGGASEIAAGIAPVIERAGGRIVVAAEVAAIILDGKGRAAGVRISDGRELRSDIVVSDAGAYNTFSDLLPGACAARRDALEELDAIPHSMAHICLYVGLRREAGEPEFDATNLWVYPGTDHDASVARFAADPSSPWPAIFISFPSAKDPTFAERYPGRSTIEVIAPVPYAMFERWADTAWKRRGDSYDAFKQGLAGRLLAELERHVPAARGRIDFSELSTPLSTRKFANYRKGEIYGAAAVPARFRARVLSARTPVKQLFLTGQDACSAGVTGALFGGVLAASAILGRNLVPVVAPAAPALARSPAAAGVCVTEV